MRRAAAAVALFLVSTPVMAVEPRCPEDAIIVFDASASMRYDDAGGPRIDVARAATAEVLPELTRGRAVGLVTYGAGPVCSTVAERLEPRPNSATAIMSVLHRLVPEGQTPLSRAVEVAASRLGAGKRAATIVLVTDGEENCGGDACRFAHGLAAASLPIRIHVIGFKLPDVAPPMLACLAAATGGRYVAAADVGELKAALKETLACPVVAGAGSAAVPLSRVATSDIARSFQLASPDKAASEAQPR